MITKKSSFLFFFVGLLLALSLLLPKDSFAQLSPPYGPECDAAGERCCFDPRQGGYKCTPPLECNSTTKRCQDRACGDENEPCCTASTGSCNLATLECDYERNPDICVQKSCGNAPGQPCCEGKICNLGSLECNTDVDPNVCAEKTCGNTGQECCPGPGHGLCNEIFLRCDNNTNQCTFNQAIFRPEAAYLCPDSESIDTAIGCVPVATVNAIVVFFWRLGIGIVGGIAILMFILGGIRFMTAGGNEDAVASAKALMTSAVAGVIMAVFSIIVLRIFGVSLLGIL